jgi:hypothetical protein
MIILAALGIAGCSDNSSSSRSGSSAGHAAAAPNGAYGPNTTATTPTTKGSTTNVANTSNLIIMAGLQLAVKNPEQAAGQAEQLVVAAGGYVAGAAEGVGAQVLPSANSTADSAESTATGASPVTLPAPTAAPNSAQALLLLRIPPSKLDSVLAKLAGSGSVEYRTQSETDVTGQVADVNSRIASAQASLTELRGMIDKAASMNDLISLEQALTSRESDLESLEAQQRALADQTGYATVTVGFYVPAAATAPSPPAAHHDAFVTALDDGWHALVATFRVILIVLGWLLPFAALVALLWWPVRRLRRLTWWSRRPGHRTE